MIVVYQEKNFSKKFSIQIMLYIIITVVSKLWIGSKFRKNRVNL